MSYAPDPYSGDFSSDFGGGTTMASPNVVGTPNNQVWASQTRIDANSSSYWWNFQLTPAGSGNLETFTTSLLSSVINSPSFIG